jgi:hypothetical protein
VACFLAELFQLFVSAPQRLYVCQLLRAFCSRHHFDVASYRSKQRCYLGAQEGMVPRLEHRTIQCDEPSIDHTDAAPDPHKQREHHIMACPALEIDLGRG